MRIAILNIYQDKVDRGAERFVFELNKRLSKNHFVRILSNINYLDFIKNKYDIIIPTNGRLQAFLIRIISWVVGSKVVISGQSGPGFDDRLNLYSFPDAFIGLTVYQAKWAKRINRFVRVEQIPNGVDLSAFKALPRKDLKKTILSVGAFTKEKRHELTIKAVSKIQGTNLVIVGSGGEIKTEIVSLGQKLLGRRFKVFTAKPEQMPSIYGKASLLAFPSVPWESFGIVLVEAMASGMPVVATNDPIRREIVGNAGIFVDPTNIEEYAKALEKTLSTDWGDKPRKQAEKFSWDNIAIQYEKLFASLVIKK